MKVEDEVKKIIQQEYKSLKAFSEVIGLPYTTVDSIFKRGFSNSSITNMIKISNKLNLDVEALNSGIIQTKTNNTFDEDEKNSKIISEIYENVKDFSEEEQLYILDMINSYKKLLDKKD